MENFDSTENISGVPLESLRKGNRVAQHKLYEIFAPKMLALCQRYASIKEEAEDMVQEGFIKVFRYLNQYTGHGNFEGWMRRIFINTALEHFRKRTYNEQLGDEDGRDISASEKSGYDALAHADLLKMVHALSDGYRTIFNLYVMEGFSHKEIANLLNITESTSKSQLSRAKTILQKSLSKVGIAA